MAIRYESGSTYFPGYETAESTIEYLSADEVARRCLKNRRELSLLEIPSVMRVAAILAERTRKPDFWIRSAVTTLDRFSREVCDGDLESALKAGQADPLTAELLNQKYLQMHQDLTSVQLASLILGPKLWWTFNGVQVPWVKQFTTVPRSHIANSTKRDFDPTTRLLMLSLVGTGLTFEDVEVIKVKDSGSLDIDGNLVENPYSDPLVLQVQTEEGPRITFLGEEAREALSIQLAERNPKSDDLLFANEEDFKRFMGHAEARGKAIIETVNDVNVTLCKTVGDFFLEWGIPGRNFWKENGLIRPED
jgi:hypothetical protein